MPINYQWVVNRLVGYPLIDGKQDVVSQVLYSVLASDESGNKSKYDGCIDTPLSSSGSFIPFDQLDPEIIIGWVKYNLGDAGVAAIELNLNAQINAIINPNPQQQPLPKPWNNA